MNKYHNPWVYGVLPISCHQKTNLLFHRKIPPYHSIKLEILFLNFSNNALDISVSMNTCHGKRVARWVSATMLIFASLQLTGKSVSKLCPFGITVIAGQIIPKWCIFSFSGYFRGNKLEQTAWETNNPGWRSKQHSGEAETHLDFRFWGIRNHSKCHISKAKGCCWSTCRYSKQHRRRRFYCFSAIYFKLQCKPSSYTDFEKSRDQRRRVHIFYPDIFSQK